MKTIPQTVFEKLNQAIRYVESILAYNLRGMQFPQNHIANYGALFKAQNVMVSSLKCQIFRLWSKLVWFTQLSTQQIQFSNLSLCLFFSTYGKISSCKKLRKSTW